MRSANVQELLDAGVHFGHQTKRWNPKMEEYIFESRNGVHIIDLRKTLRFLDTALEFIRDRVGAGEEILFVGTKKQCREILKEAAQRQGMHYVVDRWLGGTLTNFATIRSSVKRLQELETLREKGFGEGRSKKEVASLKREELKLHRNLDGIRAMTKLPGVVLVVDILREQNAVKECKRLGIPLVAIVDTNCDPAPVDFPIPGNDDGIRSTKLIMSLAEEAIAEGKLLLGKKKPSREKAEAGAARPAGKEKEERRPAAKAKAAAPAGEKEEAETDKPRKIEEEAGEHEDKLGKG